MKKILYFGILIIITMSFTTTFGYAKSEKTLNIEVKESYFKDPKDDVLIAIEKDTNAPLEFLVSMNMSTMMPNDNNTNNSWETMTPFIRVISFREKIADLKDYYKKMKSPEEKEAFIATVSSQMFLISITCQTESSGPIKGAIYFNGKEVSASCTSIPYGIVALSYNIPYAEIIQSE